MLTETSHVPGPAMAVFRVHLWNLLEGAPSGQIQLWAHGLLSGIWAGLDSGLCLSPHLGTCVQNTHCPGVRCVPTNLPCFLTAATLNLPPHTSPMGQMQFYVTDEESAVQSCDISKAVWSHGIQIGAFKSESLDSKCRD